MFDCVIGNPPYQKGNDNTFYRNFIFKGMKILKDNGVCAWITPSSWVQASNGKTIPFYRTVTENGLSLLTMLSGRDIFNIRLPVCWFICDRQQQDESVVVTTESGDIQRVGVEHVKFSQNGVEGISIIQKVKTSDPFDYQQATLFRREVRLSDKGTKTIFGVGHPDADFDSVLLDNSLRARVGGLGEHKVVWSRCNSLGRLGPVKYAPTDYACAGNACYMITRTRKESDNLIGVLTSKLYRYIISVVKTGTVSTGKYTFSFLPRVDITRPWTDSELYAEFGLSAQEIKTIEQTKL